MNNFKHFIAIVIVTAVGLLGSILVFAGMWQLSILLGVSFTDHEIISAIFLVATIIAMFWMGNKLASFNQWPLSGEPSLEQLSELKRLESIAFKASRAVEIKSKNDSMSGYILEVGKGKIVFLEVPSYAILRTYEFDEDDLPFGARTFPSSKFEIHFDTVDHKIKRIDCLGDNLDIEECYPIVKKVRAFQLKYSHARLIEQDWDETKTELKKLTKG
jgi:hypothetical protein